jgi:hypothetical protein
VWSYRHPRYRKKTANNAWNPFLQQNLPARGDMVVGFLLSLALDVPSPVRNDFSTLQA